MINIDCKDIKTLPSKSEALMDLWVRERKDLLANQLADNAEVKRRWIESNPIEVSQTQRVYAPVARAQSSDEKASRSSKSLLP